MPKSRPRGYGYSYGNETPERKDIERARNLFRKKDKTPSETKASAMSKLITDRYKMIRRAKAIVGVWGTEDYCEYVKGKPTKVNVWEPFRKALVEMGVSPEKIKEISKYEIDGENPKKRMLENKLGELLG